MKASFLRKRKLARAVLVLDANLFGPELYLTRKNFRIVPLPAGEMDADRKSMFLSQRTLITNRPEQFEDDVPISEYSLIDVSGMIADDENVADTISQAWTRFRLRSEGWFILRLRQDGQHRIEFPE